MTYNFGFKVKIYYKSGKTKVYTFYGSNLLDNFLEKNKNIITGFKYVQ